MTDREKAIVMAHTGICTMTGDGFQIFHKYVEDIMGRPIMTHEMGLLADEIMEKSTADFIALCAEKSSSEKPNKWIPCSERLPEDRRVVLVTAYWHERYQVMMASYYGDGLWWCVPFNNCGEHMQRLKPQAWMPLPEPYNSEISTGAEGE